VEQQSAYQRADSPVLLDVNVPMYAAVRSHPYKERLGHERLDTTQLYVHEAGRKNARKVMEATSL